MSSCQLTSPFVQSLARSLSVLCVHATGRSLALFVLCTCTAVSLTHRALCCANCELVAMMAGGLAQNTTLTHLDLQANQITCLGKACSILARVRFLRALLHHSEHA